MRSMLPSNVSERAQPTSDLQHLNSRADTSVVSLHILQVHLQFKKASLSDKLRFQ